MKPTALAALTFTAIIALPAIAQQGDSFVPGEGFLTNWDADEDGRITLEELNERRADIFAAFDEDEDGTLSAEEFATYDQARKDSMQRPEGRGNGAGRGEQALSLAASDTNGDGSVSLEEFLAASSVWLKVMDKDGNGIVTAGDFGAGQGQRQGAGQGKGQQQGMGQGQGKGNGQGKGRQGQMQGQQSGGQQGQGRGQGHGQGGQWQQGMGSDPYQMGQRGGQGHGLKGGQGRGGARQELPFAAFPTSDGTLWIIDTRTGDILACKTITDGTGFTPVCLEPVL